jgi:hypothetical protein
MASETPLTSGPVRLVQSDEGSDWSLQVWSGQTLVTSLVLAGSAAQYSDVFALKASLEAHSWITFSEALDLVGADPEASDPDYGVDLGRIVGDSEYVDSFFGALSFAGADFGDGIPDNPDDPVSIENALSVIADAKFESALIAKFTKNGDGVAEDVQHNEQSISGYLADYVGLSGSVGHDVLIGLDQDSVLYGGDGGSDRIFGGLGDDILIASGGNDTQDTSDELTGGAGADVFAFVSAGTVEAGLKNVHDVLVNDFNRDEGDRLLLVGYDDPNDVVIHDVDAGTNTQRVSLEDGLTVMFDLSFAREFDTNFALRLADFDKFEG